MNDAMDRGITSYGAYVPMLRLERAAIAAAHAWSFPSLRGKGVRALANWDEDAVTMSVEAARGVDLAGVSSIAFASVSPPYADLQNATLVAAALGLDETVSTIDAAGSLRAGTSLLQQALQSNAPGDALVVAADARVAKPGSAQEMTYGAGSVALKVGTENVIAKLIGSANRADAFFDHFRQTGARYDYYWEERWVRDEGYAKIIPAAAQAALAQGGISASDIAFFCFPVLMAGANAAIAKKLGIGADKVVDTCQARCGDTGAAHALLMLAGALEQATPGDRIMVVTFGGGCDVLIFEATDAIADYKPKLGVAAALASGRTEAHYTKLLSFHGQIELDWGARSEGSEKIPLTQMYRSRGQLATFDAGECPDCSAIQFPQLAACVNCGSYAPLKQHPLADEPAKMMTYTADWLQYHPAPPFYFGLVQFDNGARVMMEVVDAGPGELDVGTPLRMVYRIKSIDGERGYNRYFWKAAPISRATGD